MYFAQSPHLFFGWRRASCTPKPIPPIAKRNDAFQNRHYPVLGRGAALPLGKSSRPGSGRGGEARRIVGPLKTAVPAQPREHLSAGRWRWLDHGGFRIRQRGI